MITQQPWAVRRSSVAARFGEMEAWGAGSTTAPHTPLQEILTVKSDDVAGRVKDLQGYREGRKNIHRPGVRSFKGSYQEVSLCTIAEVLST